MTRKVIFSLSGGMDSTAMLGIAKEGLTTDTEILTVGFNYGSKHNKYENVAAQAVADHYKVPFRLINLTEIAKHLKSNLLQTGGDVPEGHYEADSMRQTVVPGRNMIFTSILAGIACSEGADAIYLGVHAGDHFIYPDCRPEFCTAMKSAIFAATDGVVELRTPILFWNKTKLIQRGRISKVPFHLTRTCYKDQETACGRCGSCQERLEAWKANDVEDPIEYESRELLPK